MQRPSEEFKIDVQQIDENIDEFNRSFRELKKSIVAPSLGWILLLLSLSIKLPHVGKLRLIAALCLIYQDIQNEKKFNDHDAKLDTLRKIYQLCINQGPEATQHSAVIRLAKTIAPFVHRTEICPWADLMDLHKINPELDKILAQPLHNTILPRINNEYLHLMNEFYSLPIGHSREAEVKDSLDLAVRIHKTSKQFAYGSNSMWAQLFAKGYQAVFSSETKKLHLLPE